MWGIISLVFLGLYSVMIYYIWRRGWTTLGKSITGIYRKIYLLMFGLLFFSFPIAEIGENYLSAMGGAWIANWGWYSMIAVVYIFIMLLIIDLIRLLDKRFKFVPILIREHRVTPVILSFFVFVLVIFSLAYGTLNARNPVITHYELEVDKQAGSLKNLKIAMVSDIHYGEVIDAKRLEGIVDRIGELKPDLIVMAGDIVEGNVEGKEAEKLVDIFSQLDSRYGIFLVPGNHDRWARNDSELLSYLQDSGINVLKDNQIKIENSFYIIGRDDPGWGDRGRKELGELMNGVESSLPLILLDHQPIDLQAAQKNKVDLQLSGHTHVGQVFPSNFITGQIYDLDWGLLKKGDYHLIVSSGYGTWGPPLRIGNNPEVVSITINFKDKN